jgi:hypothetical protein
MKTTELRKNRGWDRSSLNIHKLSELAWSMKTAGWADGHPVVFERLPDGHAEILWGHRRTLSAVIAEMSNEIASYDEMVEFIESLATQSQPGVVCPVCGEEVSTDDEVCMQCGTELLEDEVFLGVEQDIQVLDPNFLVDNYNNIIHGVDVEVPSQEVEYRGELQSQLSLIGDGLCREDADILGLSNAIQRAYELGGKLDELRTLGLSSNMIASYLAIAQLPQRIGDMVARGDLAMTIPRLIGQLENQHQREALCNLVYPHTTVSTVKRYVDRMKEYEAPSINLFDSPIDRNSDAIRAFMADMMTENDPVELWETVASNANFSIPDSIHELVPSVSCENCPLKGKVNTLPKINAPMGGYACQSKMNVKWCLYNGKEVFADYLTRDKADIEFNGVKYFSDFEKAAEAYADVSQEVADETPVEDKERPIDAQRDKIRAWIQGQSDASGRDHPMATLCRNCSYRTDGSPVKSDPTAPPCAWASKRTSIEMGFLVDEKGYAVPRCLHYGPIPTFESMIPESDPGDMPEVILDRTIDNLMGDLEVAGIPPLRMLTGVPFSAIESSVDWLRKKLENSQLSSAQKSTLVKWLVAEIDLSNKKSPVIQLPQGRTGRFKLCSTLES